MAGRFVFASNDSLRQGVQIPSLNNVGASSVTFWVRTKTIPSLMCPAAWSVSGASPTGTSRLQTAIDSALGPGYAIQTRVLDGDAQAVLNANNQATAGILDFIAMTFNCQTLALKIYKNAVLVASGTATGNTAGNTSATNSAAGQISGNEDSGSLFLDGDIEDVRLYNREITPDEITTMFVCAGVDGIVFGLQQRYCLDDGFVGQTMLARNPTDVGFRCIDASVSSGSPTYAPALATTYRRRVP
jgi:hypothetical protein